MDQHPVPQNISSYEFRLVGDMTLKQFFYVAGGGLVAFIFYKSPFPAIVRIPPAIVSVLVGILAAFVPVNGRPFSQWLLAFFKAVYSPTVYSWHPSPEIRRGTEGEVSKSLSSKSSALSTAGPLDQLESQLLSRFSALYSQVAQLLPKQQSNNSPSHKLGEGAGGEVLVTPLSTEHLHEERTNGSTLSTNNQAINPTPVQSIPHQTLFDSSQAVSSETAPAGLITPPTYPNIVAGVVVDRAGKSLEGVIIELVDNRTKIPVRAFRTNRLGQFQTATPLTPGPYTLIAEKDNQLISPVSLEVSGKIIDPVIIRAT